MEGDCNVYAHSSLWMCPTGLIDIMRKWCIDTSKNNQYLHKLNWDIWKITSNDITIRHVYNFNSQKPHWCSPICLWLVMGQSKALTVLNLCVMVLVHLIQDHNLGAKSLRSTLWQPQARKSCDLVTGVAAISSIIFFPGVGVNFWLTWLLLSCKCTLFSFLSCWYRAPPHQSIRCEAEYHCQV